MSPFRVQKDTAAHFKAVTSKLRVEHDMMLMQNESVRESLRSETEKRRALASVLEEGRCLQKEIFKALQARHLLLQSSDVWLKLCRDPVWRGFEVEGGNPLEDGLMVVLSPTLDRCIEARNLLLGCKRKQDHQIPQHQICATYFTAPTIAVRTTMKTVQTLFRSLYARVSSLFWTWRLHLGICSVSFAEQDLVST